MVKNPTQNTRRKKIKFPVIEVHEDLNRQIVQVVRQFHRVELKLEKCNQPSMT